jgi:phage FluMu protein Com
MQVRCTHCGIPFTLGKDAIHAALDVLTEQDLKHFEIRCPKCRKPNQIARERLLRAAPDWGRSEETAPS